MDYNRSTDADTPNFADIKISTFELDDQSILITKYKIIETAVTELFSDELRRPKQETVNKIIQKKLDIKNPNAIELAESICMSYSQQIIRKILDDHVDRPILLLELTNCLQIVLYLKAQ